MERWTLKNLKLFKMEPVHAWSLQTKMVKDNYQIHKDPKSAVPLSSPWKKITEKIT